MLRGWRRGPHLWRRGLRYIERANSITAATSHHHLRRVCVSTIHTSIPGRATRVVDNGNKGGDVATSTHKRGRARLRWELDLTTGQKVLRGGRMISVGEAERALGGGGGDNKAEPEDGRKVAEEDEEIDPVIPRRWWSDEPVLTPNDVPDAVSEYQVTWTQKDDHIEQDHPMLDWWPDKEKDSTIPSRVVTERDIKALVREVDQSTHEQMERKYARTLGNLTQLLPEDRNSVDEDVDTVYEQAAVDEMHAWEDQMLHTDALQSDHFPLSHMFRTPNAAMPTKLSKYEKYYDEIVLQKSMDMQKDDAALSADNDLIRSIDTSTLMDPWNELGAKESEMFDGDRLAAKYLGHMHVLQDPYTKDVPAFLSNDPLEEYQELTEEGAKMMRLKRSERAELMEKALDKVPKWTEISRKERPAAVNPAPGKRLPVALELLNSEVDANRRVPDHTGRIIRPLTDDEWDDFEMKFREVMERHYVTVRTTAGGDVDTRPEFSPEMMKKNLMAGLNPHLMEMQRNLAHPLNWQNKRAIKRWKALGSLLERHEAKETAAAKKKKEEKERVSGGVVAVAGAGADESTMPPPTDGSAPSGVDRGTIFEHMIRGSDPESMVLPVIDDNDDVDHAKWYWDDVREREIRERTRPIAFSKDIKVNEVEHFRYDRAFEFSNEPWLMDKNFRRHMDKREDIATPSVVARKRALDTTYRHEDPEMEGMVRTLDHGYFRQLRQVNDDNPISYDEIYVPDAVRETIFRLWKSDKQHWDHRRLSRRFGLTLRRVRAIVALKQMQVAYESAGVLKKEVWAYNDPPISPIYDFDHLLEAGLNLTRGVFAVTELQSDVRRADEEQWWSSRRIYRVPPRAKTALPIDGKPCDTERPILAPRRHRMVVTDISKGTRNIKHLPARVLECDGTVRHTTTDEMTRVVQSEFPLKSQRMFAQARPLRWAFSGVKSTPRVVTEQVARNRFRTSPSSSSSSSLQQQA